MKEDLIMILTSGATNASKQYKTLTLLLMMKSSNRKRDSNEMIAMILKIKKSLSSSTIQQIL
jgi:hypothetical protein